MPPRANDNTGGHRLREVQCQISIFGPSNVIQSPQSSGFHNRMAHADSLVLINIVRKGDLSTWETSDLC
ncbi:hypothetical protein POX_d05868 [Penicillium oxalicum]|uniref:Uncharacterized protein n=1 Tax=Penicillium oxalicum (strain 114-2 / CGMCC 5302) TaxID=933388 RepID=S8BAV0_PENO1|nr:hypothetical protein POX_d05868 [Penicillium oxalicum]EPS31952.1 hypothetical protein PDE_06911 [Penicillium oxalicum 114-2]KAI2790357.1 hypothetical protein POX_d05868 [Penicillium oxalicum]